MGMPYQGLRPWLQRRGAIIIRASRVTAAAVVGVDRATAATAVTATIAKTGLPCGRG